MLSMGTKGEALRRPTWASRGILHIIMFYKEWTMYARLVGMDAPRKCPKLRHVTRHENGKTTCQEMAFGGGRITGGYQECSICSGEQQGLCCTRGNSSLPK